MSTSTVPTTNNTTSPTPGSTHSHPTQQPNNTYNNILKTLALLEEAPPPLAKPVLDDSRSHLNQSGYYLSVDNVSKLDSMSNSVRGGVANPAHLSGETTTTSGGLSESKLQSILSYLDEMDKADEDLLSQISKTRLRPKTEALPTPRTASVTMKSGRASEIAKKKQMAIGNGNSEKKEKFVTSKM